MTTKNTEWLKLNTAERAHLRIYVRNAEDRGLAFDLTVKEAAHLFAQDCFYCGTPPEERAFSTANKRPYRAKLNGIDRVDASEGYSESNTVACCRACNKAKGGMTKDAFLAMARRVAKKHPG